MEYIQKPPKKASKGIAQLCTFTESKGLPEIMKITATTKYKAIKAIRIAFVKLWEYKNPAFFAIREPILRNEKISRPPNKKAKI